jgi:hypothetical protein
MKEVTPMKYSITILAILLLALTACTDSVNSNIDAIPEESITKGTDTSTKIDSNAAKGIGIAAVRGSVKAFFSPYDYDAATLLPAWHDQVVERLTYTIEEHPDIELIVTNDKILWNLDNPVRIQCLTGGGEANCEVRESYEVGESVRIAARMREIQKLAREKQTNIIIGSVNEQYKPDPYSPGKYYNTMLVVDNEGLIIGTHREGDFAQKYTLHTRTGTPFTILPHFFSEMDDAEFLESIAGMNADIAIVPASWDDLTPDLLTINAIQNEGRTLHDLDFEDSDLFKQVYFDKWIPINAIHKDSYYVSSGRQGGSTTAILRMDLQPVGGFEWTDLGIYGKFHLVER